MNTYRFGEMVCPEFNYDYIAGLDKSNSAKLKALAVYVVDLAIQKAKVAI